MIDNINTIVDIYTVTADIYKSHVDTLIRTNLHAFGITGAIMAFVLSTYKKLPLVVLSLLVVTAMCGSVGWGFFKTAERIKGEAEQLGLIQEILTVGIQHYRSDNIDTENRSIKVLSKTSPTEGDNGAVIATAQQNSAQKNSKESQLQNSLRPDCGEKHAYLPIVRKVHRINAMHIYE